MKDFLHRLMNLCSLASDGGGAGGSGGEGGDPAGGSGGSDEGNNNPPKTFTQEDLNRIAAQEKRQGAASTLKELGFEKLEDAKAAIEAYNKQKQDNMTEVEKAQQEKAEEAKKAKAAEEKAEFVEQKFAAVAAGCSADNAADVVMLAKSRMTDAKTFEDALKEIQEQYPQMFEKSDGDNSGAGSGTGGANKPPRKPNKTDPEGSRAKRLAEGRKSSNSQKSSYFTK